MNDHKNILIVRTDRIGDVILTLPLAAVLKKYFAEAKIFFLAAQYTTSIIKMDKNVDQTIQLIVEDDKLPIWKNVKVIKDSKIDTAIIANPKFRVALILFLARVKTRIGSGYRWYSFLFNKKLFEHRKISDKHELEYNFNLLKELGINYKPDIKNSNFNLKVDAESSLKVQKLLESKGVKDEKFIIIHPGSGGSAIDLPVNKFKEIIEYFNNQLRIKIVFTGSASEKLLCASLVKSNNNINLAGELNLNELAALIQKSTVFISNSTGPIHIAAALDKDIIGFYPKIRECSPVRWGPYSSKAIIFLPELDCHDCSREQCVKLNCMNTINIKKVIDAIVNILSL